MKAQDVFYYKCDGGKNPGHHQPQTIEVYKEEKYKIGLNGNEHLSLQAAEAELKKDYEIVELVSMKNVYYQKANRVIK